MAIFFNFSTTSSRRHPLHSRLVVNKDDNGKFRLERVKEVYMYFNRCGIWGGETKQNAYSMHSVYSTALRTLIAQCL